MSRSHLVSLLILLAIIAATCGTPQPATTGSLVLENKVRVMFYNVENLFDTVDNPDKRDEDFTPSGSYRYTPYRYYEKLDRISKVILNTGAWGVPAIIGFCEVENRGVVEALANSIGLRKFRYEVVHEESPDYRGIDVALMYRKDLVKELGHRAIQVNFPDDPDYKTRDILYTVFKVGRDTLHTFVNHWPSRRGGQQASNPRRVRAASYARRAVDSILAIHPNANILLMGDFNDGPEDESLSEMLGAAHRLTGMDGKPLFNYMYALKHDYGLGTHKYQQEWNTLDQFVGSRSLVDTTSSLFAKPSDAQILRSEFLLEQDPYNPGVKPFRTYAGPRYLGGYSDHLPILLDLTLR